MPLSTYGKILDPYVAVTTQASIQGFTSVEQGYNFGRVDTINYHGWRVQVGQSCLFKQTDAVLVTVGGTNYYLLDEKNLIFQENQALP